VHPLPVVALVVIGMMSRGPPASIKAASTSARRFFGTSTSTIGERPAERRRQDRRAVRSPVSAGSAEPTAIGGIDECLVTSRRTSSCMRASQCAAASKCVAAAAGTLARADRARPSTAAIRASSPALRALPNEELPGGRVEPANASVPDRRSDRPTKSTNNAAFTVAGSSSQSVEDPDGIFQALVGETVTMCACPRSA
jgi:hypothetical protein